MKLAYLLNSYPMTSTTFIRREIAAIERAGVPVKRFAVRHWAGPLVDPQDIAEQARTEYLLTGTVAGLLAGAMRQIVTRPRVTWRALCATRALHRTAGGGWLRHGAYLAQAIRLARRCAALGIDHVHAHFSTNGAAVAMLCRLLGGPSYSFTVHGPDELETLTANSLTAKTEAAAAVVAISLYCQGRLMAELPDRLWRRLHVIPCGIELGDYAPAPVPPDRRMLCVGRLCPQKGQAEIPAAVAAAAADQPGLSAVLIGDGESRAAIERAIAETGTGPRIGLLGWRSNAEVRQQLAASRALLLPSHAEGLPIVIMEALAMGRPVIATRIAAIPELVDESCGWLVEAGDGAALAAAIAAAAAADPAELDAMARIGRARVVERHDIDKIAPQLIALFERARGQAGAVPRPRPREQEGVTSNRPPSPRT